MRVVCSKQNPLRKIQQNEHGLLSTSCQCNVWFSRDLSCSIQIRVFVCCHHFLLAFFRINLIDAVKVVTAVLANFTVDLSDRKIVFTMSNAAWRRAFFQTLK